MIRNNPLYWWDKLGLETHKCSFGEWLKWLYDSIKTGIETAVLPAGTGEMMGAVSAATEIVTTPSIYLARTKRLADEVGEGLETQMRAQKLFEEGKTKELISEYSRLQKKKKGMENKK